MKRYRTETNKTIDKNENCHHNDVLFLKTLKVMRTSMSGRNQYLIRYFCVVTEQGSRDDLRQDEDGEEPGAADRGAGHAGAVAEGHQRHHQGPARHQELGGQGHGG